MTTIHWLKPVSANFNTATDWSGRVVPGASDDAVLDAAGAPYTVTVTRPAIVNGIRTASNATLDVTMKGSFTAINGTDGGVNAGSIVLLDSATATLSGRFDNTGSIVMDNAGGNTPATIQVGATGLTLTGGGTVALDGSVFQDVITGSGTGTQTLVNVDNTITGSGLIGSDAGPLAIINKAAGVVDAAPTALSPAGFIVFGTSLGGSAPVVNHGLMEATGGGSLAFANPTLSGGGMIYAGANSEVQFYHTTVTGEVLSTAAGATINIDGCVVTIEGTFHNAGAVVLRVAPSVLKFSADTTLVDGGSITLGFNGRATLKGSNAAVVLTNADNTIEGYGSVGSGTLTLINQAAGVIDANDAHGLTIDTGANTIANAGLIEGSAGGSGVIASAVDNTGTLAANGGTLTVDGAVTGAGDAVVNGGELHFMSSFTEDVAFTGATGALKLAQSQGYTGAVSGFSTTGGTIFHLEDIGFVSSTEVTYSGTATSGVLTVTDGAHTAHITLIGNYLGSTFTASADNNGGVIIVDPPKAPSAIAPAHQFIAAAAGLGGSAGEAIHTGAAWADRAPVLARPHAMIA
jgi:hypothetical protein